MAFDAERLQQHIPYYLAAKDRQVLIKELEAIASGGTADYILSDYNNSFKHTMLQGDGWRGFKFFVFDTGKLHSVRGLVLSNSCDVNPENQRDLPARVIFTPLVKLSAYMRLLCDSKIPKEMIYNKINSIKAQETTSIFYLPAGGPLEEDYIARFDEAQSMPLAAHDKSTEPAKLFTLSNVGFYMLVFKLSVHFCRLQENVNRKPAASG